jgi:hypothetical protein
MKNAVLICNVHGISDFSLTGIKKQRWKCKKCVYDTSKKYLKSLKEKCIDYKGGKCEVCGYAKCARAMHFHHKDPSLKDFSIGDRNPNTNKNGTKKWESLKPELDKCLLLCSNCHFEIHEEIDKAVEPVKLGIHRCNLTLVNSHILKGRKTPEEALEWIMKY